MFRPDRWYVLPQEMMFFVSKAMFFLPEAMGYKKQREAKSSSLLVSINPNLNQDYVDKYTILNTGSQAFARLFYELDANRLIHFDVLMYIR